MAALIGDREGIPFSRLAKESEATRRDSKLEVFARENRSYRFQR
jgi:hypothetical protein